jgi:hypothetical protein
LATGHEAPDVRFFDSHIHADTRSDEDLAHMAYFGVRGALTCAHDVRARGATEEHEAERLLDHLDRVATDEVARLRGCGIDGYAAVGVHPGAIPARLWEPVLRRVAALLAQDGVVALGEVGIHRGDEVEVELLRRQLRLARDAGRPAVLSVPAASRDARVRQTLALLAALGQPPGTVLVDHVDHDTAQAVLAAGQLAGLSIHPQHLGTEAAAAVVATLGPRHPHGLVLNTASPEGPGDVVALPRAAAALERLGVAASVIEDTCGGNARRFLGVA